MTDFNKEVEFLGITTEKITDDIIEKYGDKCEIIDYSVAVRHDSPLGKRQRTVEFKVTFMCNNVYMEAYPIYRY